MLNEQQTAHLFTFCKRHYIHYYDVQVELVDHLANAIEQQMEKNPDMKFEAALEIAYNNFGGYKGLQKIQEEKKHLVNRENTRLKWKLFRSYFTLPKALLTAVLFLGTYVALINLDNRILQVALPVFIIGLLVREMRIVWRYQHRMFQNKEQLLLFQGGESFYFFALWLLVFNRIFEVLIECFTSPLGTAEIPLVSMVICLPLYFITINCMRAYLQKVHHKARTMYPELFVQAA
jgi:hypothetical protein